jgi:hypothetical protein
VHLELLGHASLLVRGDGAVLLVDPVLGSSFDAGMRIVWPPRTLDASALPSLDGVVLTGRDPHQLDLPSIAQLPRDAPLFIADDPGILRVLRAAGFHDVQTIAPGTETRFSSLSLALTANGGLLIAEGEATAWRMPVSGAAGGPLLPVRKRIDVALVPEPVDETLAMYAERLADVVTSGAETLVALAGWRRASPVAGALGPGLERFARDLTDLDPAWQGRVLPGLPGDVLRVDPGTVALSPAASASCKRIARAPAPAPTPVLEPAPAMTHAAAGEAVHALIEDALALFVAEHPLHFEWHGRWAVRHAIEIIFADGVDGWTLDFSGPRGQVAVEHRVALDASSHAWVAAGALLRLVAGAVTWEQLVQSGAYHHEARVYRVGRCGLHAAPAVRVPDPLQVMLGSPDAVERGLIEALAEPVGEG